MPGVKCSNCGSRSIRADRALAGRLVCNDCGYPISGKRYQKVASKTSRRYMYLVYFIVVVFIILLFVG